MSVSTSPGAGAFDFVDSGVTAVIAWLSVRLLTANRILVSENFDEPRSGRPAANADG
jgi:hypothetical protein